MARWILPSKEKIPALKCSSQGSNSQSDLRGTWDFTENWELRTALRL
jgi:hypothetical protein